MPQMGRGLGTQPINMGNNQQMMNVNQQNNIPRMTIPPQSKLLN